MELTFRRDAYRSVLDTEVVAVGVEEEQPFAVTADTVFYPEGGGQPSDRGSLGGLAVVDVRVVAGEIRHYVTTPAAPGPARLEIDWPRRWDHMQQHTAQHLLTAIALARFGWPTTAFHLGPGISDIELDVASLERADLDRLEEAVNVEVRAGRAVSVRSADRSRLAELGVRSRILPQDLAEEQLRLVEIEGIDLNTCGGTHVRSTAEIGAVALLGTEPMRGGTRVFFVAGDRLRRRLVAHELRNSRLRALLDSGDDDLPAVVELRLDRERQLAGERRRLVERLAEAVATVLAGRPEALLSGHWDDLDAGFLQRLALRLAELEPAKVALLTAGTGSEGVFAVVAGAAAPLAAAEVGPQVAEVLGGRGGGTRAVFQGKATRMAGVGEAIALLRERLGS